VTPIDYEGIHQMFDGLMFDLCSECGGSGCEYNTIGVLMPGEAEFIACKLGPTAEEFIERYCNTVSNYQGHDVHTFIGLCKFLSPTYRCELEAENCKPLTCLFYPAMIGFPGQPKLVFLDDVDCPMAHRVNDSFKERAFAILETLKEQLPEWWLNFNLQHCWPIYHEDKLHRLSEKQVITVEELMGCEVERE